MNGYNSDNEEIINQDIKEKKQRKKRMRKTKRRNTLTSNKTLKQIIPNEYKNSIYYDTRNFDVITKNILASDLLGDKNDIVMSNYNNYGNNQQHVSNNQQHVSNKQNIINQKLTANKQSTKKMTMSVIKSNINGKTITQSKIIIDNSKSPYIKEYININGKKTLKQIKK